MRTARILGENLAWAGNCYHLMSRAIEGRFIFDGIGKERFRQLLERHAEMAGIEIIGDEVTHPQHDLDGNLTHKGNRSYTWDAENRLTEIHEFGSLVATYTYDHQSRRIARRVPSLTIDERYLYQGWNLAAVYNAGVTEPEERYTWGKDLSGSLQGAGGVGGLLFGTKRGIVEDAWVYQYDANGNVTGITSNQGKVLDTYVYTPFGEAKNVELLSENRFRFSTKSVDQESGFCYYGFRYYEPMSGRWLSRDPIAELGGLMLYGFAGNDPINHYDVLGNAVETGWDLFNVVVGVVEFGVCVASGNVVGAAIALGTTTVDIAATMVPGVPGGASSLAKSTRVARSVPVSIVTSKPWHTAMKNHLKTRTEGTDVIRYLVRKDIDEAHHILPRNGPSAGFFASSYRKKLRDDLDDIRQRIDTWGVDIDTDINNLVSLTKHDHGVLTFDERYYARVRNKLINAYSKTAYRKAVNDLAKDLLQDSGKIP